MPRKFYSSKKRTQRSPGRQTSSRPKKRLPLEDFSQNLEKSSTKEKAMALLGIFIYCFLLGGLLATILNTSTVGFLLKFGGLPAL